MLGGGGFIGKHLSEALLQEGFEVRVFERPHLDMEEHLTLQSRVEWVEGDFKNPADVLPALDGCDWVFHLISTTLPKTSNENPIYDLESNVVSTLRLLDLIVRPGSIRKLIYISSGGTVYGVPEATPIPESHPTNPRCAYGIGKLAVEKYLDLYRLLHGIDYAVLRLANPYGEYQHPLATQGVIPVFMYKALNDEPIEIWGDGSVVRDYIYIGDAIRAMLKVMRHDGEARIFNIGSGRGTSLNVLVQVLEDLLNRPVRRTFLPQRRFDVPVNVLDITRARTVLDWEPLVTLEEGMERMLSNMRRDRAST